MKDSHGKSKPTLDSLLKDQQVISGKDLIERHKEEELQKDLLQEAIEFEQRNRRTKQIKSINPQRFGKLFFNPFT